jgi:hypothetical protein
VDAGARAVEALYTRQLKIDDYWAERTRDGFRWWADKQAQTVEVIGQEEGGPDGAVGYLVSVRTDVVRGVDLDDRKLAVLNAEVMSFASMAGLVYDEEAHTLSLGSLARVWDENLTWLTPLLGMAAVLQIHEARMWAPSLAASLGAESLISGHPGRGVRVQPDEMAGAAEALVMPTGREASVWSDSELEAAVQLLEEEPGVLSSSFNPDGLTVDVAFGEVPSRCQVLNHVKHPLYGSGLLVLQALPLAPQTEPEGAGLALAFNGIELAREPLGYGFGSYAWRDQRMYFISFLPNALYRMGLLPNLVASCAQRARSLHSVLSQAE